MASLRGVLLQNLGADVAPKNSLGGDDEQEQYGPHPPVIDRDRLQRDLMAANKDNSRYFLICVIMVLLLFILSVGIVIANLSNPDVIKVVMAAFGISSAGLITMMIKLWREKSNVELLILLAINMDSDTLKTVVTILARRI